MYTVDLFIVISTRFLCCVSYIMLIKKKKKRLKCNIILCQKNNQISMNISYCYFLTFRHKLYMGGILRGIFISFFFFFVSAFVKPAETQENACQGKKNTLWNINIVLFEYTHSVRRAAPNKLYYHNILHKRIMYTIFFFLSNRLFRKCSVFLIMLYSNIQQPGLSCCLTK